MDWHRRYMRQAGWTKELRTYLFESAGVRSAHHVLEVGCGTGAVMMDLGSPGAVFGLDIDLGALEHCRRHIPSALLVGGDALTLPFASHSIDIVYCHFLLLWVRNPIQAILEMKRVTRPGGSILSLAEPDYGSRLDEPAELAILGHWQAESLRQQGADPTFGSRLASTFSQAGLHLVETGRLESRTPGMFSINEWESEWEVLESDLAGRFPLEKLAGLKHIDLVAWQEGRRRLDIPTYFAFGRV